MGVRRTKIQPPAEPTTVLGRLAESHSRLLGTGDITRLYGLPSSTTIKWMDEGVRRLDGSRRKIPFIRIGNRRKVDRRALAEFLEAMNTS